MNYYKDLLVHCIIALKRVEYNQQTDVMSKDKILHQIYFFSKDAI